MYHLCLCHSMKSTVEDKAKDKVSAEDKKTVLDAVKEALEWVEENTDAEADEFKDKLKEVRCLATHCEPLWGWGLQESCLIAQKPLED
jgi:molecular chaperone DnaK (HSP70)